MDDEVFYTIAELLAAGFSSVGKNVRVSRKCSLYCISGSIGSHVRIDDFSILKGHIVIGSHVHICAYCSVSGICGVVTLSDFSTLANRVSIYTGSDDYRADSLSSSTVPDKYLVTIKGSVFLGRAALIGAHSVILPGTFIEDAVSVGALCIIHGFIPAGTIITASLGQNYSKNKRDVAKILEMAAMVSVHDELS